MPVPVVANHSQQQPMYIAQQPIPPVSILNVTKHESTTSNNANTHTSVGFSVAEKRKLVIVGDGACGKTCLLMAFCAYKEAFMEQYIPTVFENHTVSIEYSLPPQDNSKNAAFKKAETSQLKLKMELTLWDTAGQEDYDRLRPLSYPDTHVILLCYAVDSPLSLEHAVTRWAPEIKHYCPNVPVVLVGLKSDLRKPINNTPNTNSNVNNSNSMNGGVSFYVSGGRRIVRHDEAQSAAFRIGAVAVVECSAKGGIGVQQVFEKAIGSIIQRQQLDAANASRRRCSFLCGLF